MRSWELSLGEDPDGRRHAHYVLSEGSWWRIFLLTWGERFADRIVRFLASLGWLSVLSWWINKLYFPISIALAKKVAYFVVDVPWKEALKRHPEEIRRWEASKRSRSRKATCAGPKLKPGFESKPGSEPEPELESEATAETASKEWHWGN